MTSAHARGLEIPTFGPAGSNAANAHYILGTRVDPSNYTEATELILSWARRREARYVCVANVHMLMEAYDDPSFQEVVNGADFVTSDGMPLVWALRAQGARSASRVYGPDLTPLVCEAAAREAVPVGFYGASDGVREKMVEKLKESYPDLIVAFSESPPYRELSPEEEEETAARINASGAAILFVGLGCPKQERWMSRNVTRIDTVMLGVGAAFDFIAGSKRKAPPALQAVGLEWLFRLATEPKRLWKRYLYNNPRFVLHVARERLGGRNGRNGSR